MNRPPQVRVLTFCLSHHPPPSLSRRLTAEGKFSVCTAEESNAEVRLLWTQTALLHAQEADCRARAGVGCTDPRCHFHVHRRGCGGAYIKVPFLPQEADSTQPVCEIKPRLCLGGPSSDLGMRAFGKQQSAHRACSCWLCRLQSPRRSRRGRIRSGRGSGGTPTLPQRQGRPPQQQAARVGAALQCSSALPPDWRCLCQSQDAALSPEDRPRPALVSKRWG